MHQDNNTTSRSRIALIAACYPPIRNSAAVQVRDLAQEMLRQGHDLVVIVPDSTLQEPSQVMILDGVNVLRLRAPKFMDVGYIKRTLAELSLPFLMLWRLRKSIFARVEWDLIVWYSPTIFFGPLIWFMKRSNKCRTYLILRDIFPEWAVDLGLISKGPIYWFFKAVASLQYAVADIIGVQTESNVKFLAHWAKKPNKRVEVLHNWLAPASNLGSSIDLAKTSLAGRKICVYIGNMGVAQGMDVLIELADSLRARADLGFIFVGRGSEVLRLKQIVKARALTNTLFFDEVSPDEMLGLLAQCFIGLIALDPRHKTHNIPGKFLTYLQAGLPVLASINYGTDLAEIIYKEKVGGAFAGDSVVSLIEFIDDLISNTTKYKMMSEHGCRLARSMFSSHSAVKQITSIITK
jgi:glycosyltransferase involved in cell wall biosynthesis